MVRIGLIAGHGRLPIVFSKVARQKGDTVIGFGLKGVTDSDLESHVTKMHWLEWGNLQKVLLLLVTERIGHVIMLGKVDKELLFKREGELDDKARGMLQKIRDKKDYVILNEVANAFNKLGMEVIDSTTYLKDLIPLKGAITALEPTERQWADINFGRDVGKELAKFDIGQTAVIKDKTVVAVEAMEGTDETIRRSGQLTGGGFTVVKVARPNQDMRFDVPLVGLETLKAIIQAGGSALAVEEKRTLLMDRTELVKLADENRISIVAI